MLELIEDLGRDDLVICLISSLLPYLRIRKIDPVMV